MNKLQLTFLFLVIAFPFSLFAETPDLKSQRKINDMWENYSKVKAGGILGERLKLWRENRLWYVVTNDNITKYDYKKKVLTTQTNVNFVTIFGLKNEERGWTGEHIGKWLHAATLAYEKTNDPELLKKLKYVVGFLLSSQEKDGYLGTYKKGYRFTDIRGGGSWDIWTHRYNLYGLLTYEKYHKDDSVVEACTRMGDLLIDKFGPGKANIMKFESKCGLSSATLIESIMMLYERTKEKRFLEFAEHIVSLMEKEPCNRLLSAMLNKEDVSGPGYGKAYQLMAASLGFLEIYRHTGKEKYLKATMNAWENISDKHLDITGGPWGKKDKTNPKSNAECFAKPHFWSPNEEVEVCSTVTWVELCLSLFRLTGEARYANEAERTLLNKLFGDQSPDGMEWDHHNGANSRLRKWRLMSYSCCASSGPRGLEMYADHLIGGYKNGLSFNSYLPLKAELSMFNNQLKGVQVKGNYPFDNKVEVELNLTKALEMPVYFRLPLGVSGMKVIINKKEQKLKKTETGFLVLSRKWRPDEKININFTFSTTAHYKEDAKGKNWVCFTYGPLVLATELKGKQKEITIYAEKTSVDGMQFLEPISRQITDKTTKTIESENIKFRIKNIDENELMPFYQAGGKRKAFQTYFAIDSILREGVADKPVINRAIPKWFTRKTGFGLFLHWGPWSAKYNGSCGWMLFRGKQTCEEFAAELGPRFKPENYDPNIWMKAASGAGFTYAVITTRHHDGYELWPTKIDDNWGTKGYMDGRDLLKPYVEACKKNDIRVGFYFSPTDWMWNPKGWPHRGYPYKAVDYLFGDDLKKKDKRQECKKPLRGSLARPMVVWMLCKYSGLTQREAWRRIGYGTGAAVSQQKEEIGQFAVKLLVTVHRV